MTCLSLQSRAAPTNLGNQLADALRAGGAEWPEIAGYLQGVLNDIALVSPEARRRVEYHISAERADRHRRADAQSLPGEPQS